MTTEKISGMVVSVATHGAQAKGYRTMNNAFDLVDLLDDDFDDYSELLAELASDADDSVED